MNIEARTRIKALRRDADILILERPDHHGVLRSISRFLSHAFAYFSRDENLTDEEVQSGIGVLVLILKELDDYRAGRYASPYGAWMHAYPFKMKYLDLQKSTQLQLPI